MASMFAMQNAGYDGASQFAGGGFMPRYAWEVAVAEKVFGRLVVRIASCRLATSSAESREENDDSMRTMHKKLAV